MKNEREVREVGRGVEEKVDILKASSMKNGILSLYFYIELDKELIEKKLLKAMVNGAEATYPDGRKSWISHREILDASKEASAMYTWDRTGNKVRCKRILFTDKNGEITERDLGRVWIGYDRI